MNSLSIVVPRCRLIRLLYQLFSILQLVLKGIWEIRNLSLKACPRSGGGGSVSIAGLTNLQLQVRRNLIVEERQQHENSAWKWEIR